MAHCPACRYRFATLEDEDDGQHECPRCGFDCHAQANTRTDEDVEGDLQALREEAESGQ